MIESHWIDLSWYFCCFFFFHVQILLFAAATNSTNTMKKKIVRFSRCKLLILWIWLLRIIGIGECRNQFLHWIKLSLHPRIQIIEWKQTTWKQQREEAALNERQERGETKTFKLNANLSRFLFLFVNVISSPIYFKWRNKIAQFQFAARNVEMKIADAKMLSTRNALGVIVVQLTHFGLATLRRYQLRFHWKLNRMTK